MFTSVSLELLQVISLKFSDEITSQKLRFLRTRSKTVVSEATVAYYLRSRIFSFIEKGHKYRISGIIKKKQANPIYQGNRLAS